MVEETMVVENKLIVEVRMRPTSSLYCYAWFSSQWIFKKLAAS